MLLFYRSIVYLYIIGMENIFISAWGLRCSFYYDGQCEGLKVWDEQQISLPRFFVSDKITFFNAI